MPPVDIGCAASDSQGSFFAAQPLCDKVQCVPLCLKTHKVQYRFHRPWIFEIRMVGVRQMTVEGTSGA